MPDLKKLSFAKVKLVTENNKKIRGGKCPSVGVRKAERKVRREAFDSSRLKATVKLKSGDKC